MRGKKKELYQLSFSTCVADPTEKAKKQEFLKQSEKGEKWAKESFWCPET